MISGPHWSCGGCPTDTKAVLYNVEQANVHYSGDHPGVACAPSIEALIDEHYLGHAPRDRWGRPLSYVCPGLHTAGDADVVSAGKDGRFGTADDIRSWDL